MGFGAGHIADMANQMRQNRAQLASKRSKFKENNREGIYSSKKKPQYASYKTLSKEELNQRKKQIQEHAKAERKKERILLGVLALLGIITLVGVIIWSS